LLEVKHTHDHYPPSTTFAYDADGNMLNDELGQRLHYDSQGRLFDVETASGNLTSQPLRRAQSLGINHTGRGRRDVALL